MTKKLRKLQHRSRKRKTNHPFQENDFFGTHDFSLTATSQHTLDPRVRTNSRTPRSLPGNAIKTTNRCTATFTDAKKSTKVPDVRRQRKTFHDDVTGVTLQADSEACPNPAQPAANCQPGSRREAVEQTRAPRGIVRFRDTNNINFSGISGF